MVCVRHSDCYVVTATAQRNVCAGTSLKSPYAESNNGELSRAIVRACELEAAA